MALSIFGCAPCRARAPTDRACSVGILCGCCTYALQVGRACIEAHADLPKHEHGHLAPTDAPSCSYGDGYQHRARETCEALRQERALDPEWTAFAGYPHDGKSAGQNPLRRSIGTHERC